MIHRRFPVPFIRWHTLESHVNISVFDSNSFIMFLSTPAPAKSFSINTNSRDLDYQVSTKAILEIIRNNPQGLTLTEIAQKVDPNWQSSNCKRMFKQAIDPLCLRDGRHLSRRFHPHRKRRHGGGRGVPAGAAAEVVSKVQTFVGLLGVIKFETAPPK